MERQTMTGGCQCGAVRYSAAVDPEHAYLCHCRMCQRATGGVAAPFVNLAKSDCAWQAEPQWYASSPIARRAFCASCGTPLAFAYNKGDDMDLMVGTFDEPGAFAPHWHFGAESLHEAWLDTSALPRKKSTENEELKTMWIEAAGKMPD